MVVDFGKHFNKKINEIKVTWRFMKSSKRQVTFISLKSSS